MAEQTPVVAERDSADAIVADGYAPYGQLVKMLLPSAGSIAIYDAQGELVWCSDGYERPDLRGLLESIRGSEAETLSGRGSVEHTSAGVPAFVAGLKGQDGAPLGSLVLELSQGQSARYSGSMVASLLRPVLDCLESRMNLERTILSADRDDAGDLELLLSVDAEDREDATALEQLLRHCVEHLSCALGAFLIPDKNLMLSCSADPADARLAAARSHAEALAGLGAAQQSPHGGESRWLLVPTSRRTRSSRARCAIPTIA